MALCTFFRDFITIRRTLLEVLGLTATPEILKKVNEKGKAKCKDLRPFASVSTLNIRLLQLTHLGLLKHKIVRNKEKREEWYEITEKGEKVLKIIEQLDEAKED